jgi:hypothetical protein
MTEDDVEAYGESLIDLAKRAAQEAMRPELNALRQELISKLADVGSDKTRVAPPPPTGLITSEEVDAYGEELIDLAKRAAQEAMRPELNALRQELLSEFPAAAGEGSEPMTMIRVAELREAVDRARDEINDPRVFDDLMRRSMIKFACACAKASYPAIVDEPDVAAACDAFIKGVVGLLFARAAAAKAGLFKRTAANFEIDRAAFVAHTAYDCLNETVKKAMVTNVGYDGTDEGFMKALTSLLNIEQDDVDGDGEELIDLAKRAAQEAMRPELNAPRQELLSEFHAAAGERSGPKISVQTGPVPARLSECGPGAEKSIDLKTTVMFTGLATSLLSDAFVYTVSTIYRKDLGGLYQTSIFKHQSPRSGAGEMVYRIEVASQLKSVREHIDTVRMALTNPEYAWEGTKDYQNELMNKFSGESYGQTRPLEMSWTDKRIKMLIMAANINYEPGFISRLFSGWAA